MTFKGKVLGTLSAVVLTMSMAFGVSAEPSSLSVNENPNGVCSASAGTGTVDFGTYEWNGTNFVRTSPQPTLTFTVSQTYAPIGTTVSCDVSVTASDLSNVTHPDPAYIVPQAALSLSAGTGQGAISGTHWMYGNGTTNFGPKVVDGGEGDYSFNLGISHASSPSPNNRIKAVGTYEGTVIITVSKNTGP